jgi:N-acetylglucosaminyldiphosphoundecaprenol N-acetyl-beta-D-mannosaminyltransferase
MVGIPKRGVGIGARNFLELHRRIHCIDDQHARDQLLEELQHPSRPYIVSFVNAHAANLVWNTPSLVESLLSSDLLLRDGIGVQLGLKAFGRPHGLNMNGTDFIPQIARAYSGRRVALFGTRSPWLESAREKLESEGLVVVASHDGFSSLETYLDLAATTEPELVILAMGMPKQEHLAVRLRDRLSHPVLIVNGGAVLDFVGDKVTRAPKLLRNSGMEWAYRLSLEPRRLSRRYLLGIPTFFSHVAMTRLVVPRAAKNTSPPP